MFKNYLYYASINKDNLKTESYYVLYVDILGYRGLLKSDNDLLIKVKYLLSEIVIGKMYGYTNNPFKYKIFSDNIIIGIKIDENKALERLIGFASRMQSKALLHFGFLMRGSIVRGDLYIDQDIVFGDALVRAYILESSICVVPRIILDADLYNDEYVLRSKYRICSFEDEYKFVNYLHFYFLKSLEDKNRGTHLSEIFTYINDQIIRLKDGTEASERALIKVLWADKFHKHILAKQGVLEYYNYS